MKNVILAAAAAVGFAGAAFAETDRPVSFLAYGEYAAEAAAFEFGAGAGVNVSDLSLGVTAVVVDNATQEFDFDHLDLNVGYAVTDEAKVYGKVTLDDSLEYSESVVGVALSF